MQKQRLTPTVMALAAAGMLTACGTETGSGSGSVGSEPRLAGVHWSVESVTVNGKKQQAPTDAYVKIGDKGKAEGNYGCNGFTADVSTDGDTVDFANALSTKRACDKLDFENAFKGALGKGELKAAVDGDKLTLTTDKGERVALTSEPDVPLTGTKWNVNAIGDGKTTASLPKEVDGKAHLTFDEDGMVRGKLGCNNVSAKAEVKGDSITLGAPRSTRMMCEGAAADAEKKLLKLFDGKVDFKLTHRGLSLTTADGTVVSANADLKQTKEK
ncbi:META domain-containing protein [Streptomyces sp. BA2]|uniref:META domain-containing protein n=1 Tax=Streptomyces sp. BA2 TaxID=436595 RepID=UPI0013229431|nr:META domain-containing protein [Streptomyces sp. BA2]MWA12153.1 META domain-containing protein [Streptomyces sp. BA2]